MSQHLSQNGFGLVLRREFGPDWFPAVRELATEFSSEVSRGDIPIDIELYANHFGIRVLPYKIPSDGFLTTGKKLRQHVTEFGSIVGSNMASDIGEDDSVIVVQSLPRFPTKAQRRKYRFTIAHELGHWYLRKRLTDQLGAQTFMRDDPEEERLCDLFAAELLVPTLPFVRELTTPNFGLRRILETADEYNVRLSTLLVKIASLSRRYAAFAIFGQKYNYPVIRFTTPVRLQAVFYNEQIRTDVKGMFCGHEEQRTSRVVRIRGRSKKVAAKHISINDEEVLSFIHAVPFEARIFYRSLNPSQDRSEHEKAAFEDNRHQGNAVYAPTFHSHPDTLTADWPGLSHQRPHAARGITDTDPAQLGRGAAQAANRRVSGGFDREVRVLGCASVGLLGKDRVALHRGSAGSNELAPSPTAELGCA